MKRAGQKLKTGICVDPYGSKYASYGAEKYEKIRQHGFEAVDFSIADTGSELYRMGETELKRKLTEEKASADLAGIEISQVHGPWRWPPRDTTEEDRRERMEKMKRSVVIAELLSCPYVVVHPIMPFGIEELGTEKANATWELNVDFFSELVSFAKQHGITVCIENMPMPAFSLATPGKVLELVEAIGGDNLKICLDVGHVAVFQNLSAGDEVRKLGRLIKVLHVHDNMGDGDYHLHPTKGITNWRGFVDALYGIGFEGVFSLETVSDGELSDGSFEAGSIALCRLAKGLL